MILRLNEELEEILPEEIVEKDGFQERKKQTQYVSRIVNRMSGDIPEDKESEKVREQMWTEYHENEKKAVHSSRLQEIFTLGVRKHYPCAHSSMSKYVVLLRGINVGGKNILSMRNLKQCLEEAGFENVTTYIASGNLILESKIPATEVKTLIEKTLPERFSLDSKFIKALVLSPKELKEVIDHKPKGFGEMPNRYHSDVIFLIDRDVTEAMTVFHPREGVDTVWPGKGVVYSQRLSEQRTKSRLKDIMSTPLYKSMTIRTWNTTLKLLELARDSV